MNNPDPTPTQKYKRHDEAFKRQAVEHWRPSGNLHCDQRAASRASQVTQPAWSPKRQRLN